MGFNNGDEAAGIRAYLNGLGTRPAYAFGQSMWRKIRANIEDVVIGVSSDSTWNANEEPFYRYINEVFRQQVPTHTVLYEVWLDGSGWTSVATLQTGSGAQTIRVRNAAIPGSGLSYANGANEQAIWGDYSYDLFIYNHGHNHGFLLNGTDLLPYFIAQVAKDMARHTKAEFFVTLQNPWLRNLGFSRATQATWRTVASLMGCGIIDVSSKFEALGDLDDPAVGGEGGTVDLAYYDQDGQGGLHPVAPAGVNLAITALTEALSEGPATGQTAQPVSPLLAYRENLISNPAYADWTGSAPTGHTFTSLTPAKAVGYTRGGVYGLGMTVTAAAAVKSIDLSGALPTLRGKWLTYCALVWQPSSMSSRTGRVQIVTAGATNRNASSIELTNGKGGWTLVQTALFINSTDTSITLNMLAGPSSGTTDNGEAFYCAWEWAGVGILPSGVDPSAYRGAFINDLYDATATGIPSGFTGTLAVTGSTIAVTAGTAPNTRAYFNVRTVAGRSYRIAWTTRTFSAAAGLTMSARGPNGGGTNILTTGAIINNSSFDFVATGSLTGISINGGSNVTEFTVNGITATELYSGLTTPVIIELTAARNSNGSVIDATGAANNFKVASTVGTSLRLQTENAQGNTKTDTAVWELIVPASYIPGRILTAVVGANHVAGSGTVGTATVDVQAYELVAAGTESADLCSTAAQNITGTAAEYSFVITGTGLVPGDRIRLAVVVAIQETGGANTSYGQINSVRLA